MKASPSSHPVPAIAVELAADDPGGLDFSSGIFRETDGGVEHVILETNGSSEDWFRYRGSAAPDSADLKPLGESWKDMDEVRFAVAVPVDEQGHRSSTLHSQFTSISRVTKSLGSTWRSRPSGR
jgi:hypothetical protein